ncbi:TRAP transporter small permease [Halobacillus seohaensis]|uniref:TRAP transporter small permease n=1 Tax=Halobacillus seohaensis TaxID=447421 RepID=A0ABW2ELN8_9BACI
MKKRQLSKLNKLFHIFNKITSVFAILTSAAIFVVVIWQIVGRLIGHPAPWTEELTRFIFIWMIFLGIGIGFRKVESARVTVFLKLLPQFIQKISVWIYSVATISFFIFMVIYGVEFMSQQLATNETSSVVSLPMWVMGMSVPCAGVIGIINVIQSLVYDRELI